MLFYDSSPAIRGNLAGMESGKGRANNTAGSVQEAGVKRHSPPIYRLRLAMPKQPCRCPRRKRRRQETVQYGMAGRFWQSGRPSKGVR